ncbi:MAG: hypothetical protein ACO38P_10210, partial [Phycisphaerales bacterium]
MRVGGHQFEGSFEHALGLGVEQPVVETPVREVVEGHRLVRRGFEHRFEERRRSGPIADDRVDPRRVHEPRRRPRGSLGIATHQGLAVLEAAGVRERVEILDRAVRSPPDPRIEADHGGPEGASRLARRPGNLERRRAKRLRRRLGMPGRKQSFGDPEPTDRRLVVDRRGSAALRRGEREFG